MSKQANPTLIGAFVLGALALAILATLLLAGGTWFGERRQHVLYFEGAAQGLQVGAPVVFLGVKVGTVKEIQLGLDQSSLRFLVPVIIEIEPNVVHTRNGQTIDLRDRGVMRGLVERGLRGRLRMQSLLTGQLYVDLDDHRDQEAETALVQPQLDFLDGAYLDAEEYHRCADLQPLRRAFEVQHVLSPLAEPRSAGEQQGGEDRERNGPEHEGADQRRIGLLAHAAPRVRKWRTLG